MTYDASEAVLEGAKLLDSEVPGWYNRISPETLDLSSNSECVLGQIFGAYDEGCETLFGFDWEQPAQDNGFFPNIYETNPWDRDEYRQACAVLQAAWSREIFLRVAQDLLTPGW